MCVLGNIVLYGIGILGFSWMRHNAMQQHGGTDWSLPFFSFGFTFVHSFYTETLFPLNVVLFVCLAHVS